MTDHTRRLGLLLPLFSLRTTRDWGIGEIGDLPAITRWLRAAGQRLLQLLPINELPDHEMSPYAALSGMAIDPRYISLHLLPDHQVVGDDAAHDVSMAGTLMEVRRAPRVRYAQVRVLKEAAFRRAYARFVHVELRGETPRAQAFATFVREQGWWLDTYAVFRALRERFDGQAWTGWPEPLRHRHEDALAAVRAEMGDEMRYRQYLQWVAHEQWTSARRAGHGVALFGDLPFMVARDSADVWARQDQFRLDASLGVPPDVFSETGQDWALPVYRWDVMEQGGFEWLTARARRNADLFDGYRVDHLVGFFRTFFREPSGESGFTPAEEPEQTALGERILGLFLASGATIVAEDLGVVPEFVRASMARLGVPGCKVFRWERQWLLDGQPFVDPADYPVRSVATTGTHDTEPLVTWWAGAPEAERLAALALPLVQQRLGDRMEGLAASPALPDEVRDALIEAVVAAASELVILPVQDVFGWADRINTPALVDDVNWTWRLPWPVESIEEQPDAARVTALLRLLAERHRR